MKATSIIPIIMVLLILLMRPDNDASAFHDGGVGACDACHSMHKASTTSTNDSNSLLKSSDSSSTCLNCHQQTGDVGPRSYHISTPWAELSPGVPPKQLSPAGDFGWLKKDFAWNSSGVLHSSPGLRHGHNINAADYLYFSDTTIYTAPGGNYPTASLTCISCHDPHGKYRRDASGSIATTGTPIKGSGSYASSADPQADFSVGVYRLLGGKNYQPKSLSSFGFVNDPPVAVAPDAYNRAESLIQTRVAYGSGMSEWCENCHTAYASTMHNIVSSGTSTPQPHPVGSSALLGSTISANYNAYIKTGNLTGNTTTSFLSLVPFEEGISSTYATLKLHAKSDGSYMSGPFSGAEQVMCLTCHRAHASGWDYATRWNTNTDYVVWNGYYSQDGQQYQPYGQGRTELEAQQAYYGMKAGRFALNQDTLCHKCHAGTLP